MREYNFDVYFDTGNVVRVITSNKIRAEILACAEEIKKGNDYVVSKIIRLED